MYENIGEKIKGLAQIIGWVELVAGLVAAIVFWCDADTAAIGFICLVGGIVMFLSSWFLYGFGQLVEDVSAIRNKPVQTVDAPTVIDELPEL